MRTLALLILILVSPVSFAKEPNLYHVKVDLKDKEKLQRGARYFMNYCSGCHSLKYIRYSRLGKDLNLLTFDGDLDEALLYNNLIFTQAKVHDPIQVSMQPENARQWFGVIPPDLSLITRVRGTDWIYTYLKSFYEDPSRPFGTNNLLIPEVAMPNVLSPLIGQVKAIKNEDTTHHDEDALTLIHVKPGEMTESEFDGVIEDLVTFLAYVAEPEKLLRHQIGYFVLFYLLVLLALVYPLKRLYWKRLKARK